LIVVGTLLARTVDGRWAGRTAGTVRRLLADGPTRSYQYRDPL